MPRLLRPHIPLRVRCIVAYRQIRSMTYPATSQVDLDNMYGCSPQQMVDASSGKFQALLDDLLRTLGRMLDTSLLPIKLALDHDPALENRRFIYRKGVHVGYIPDANDPEHLVYRTKADHEIKTNVRGDGAQYCDRALAKRERRRKKKAVAKTPRQRTRKNRAQKRKWPSRPLRGGGRWPPKSARKPR